MNVNKLDYKPLFKLLIDKEIDSVKLINDEVLSRSTMLKIKKGEFVSLVILTRICKYLNCKFDDIVAIKDVTEIPL